MSERWLSDNLLERITATVIEPTWNDSISMAHEIRERRAADLSTEELDVLRNVVSDAIRELQSDRYMTRPGGVTQHETDHAWATVMLGALVAISDKLLASEGK